MKTLQRPLYLLLIAALLIGLLPTLRPASAPVEAQSERLQLSLHVSEAELTSVVNTVVDLIPGLGNQIKAIEVDLQAPDLMCLNITVPGPFFDLTGYICLKVELIDGKLAVKVDSFGLGDAPRALSDNFLKSLKKPVKKLVRKTIRKVVKNWIGSWKLATLDITDDELILTVSND